MKQPKALYYFSFAEIWDRFSYYGIQATLIIYLTRHFLFNDHQAYTIYGIYTALAFITPMLGGVIADYFLGPRTAILFGLCCMVLGNAALLLGQLHYIYLGLTLLIFGIGLFKSNNSAMVGTLYDQPGLQKENGFTIFYVSMNIGASLGPISYGFLLAYAGWRYGIAISILMLSVSWAILKLNQYSLIKRHHTQHNLWLLFGGIVVLIGFMWCLFFSNILFTIFIWALLIGVGFKISWIVKKETVEQRKKLALLLFLTILAICYYIANIQIGSSLLLYIERFVNTNVLGFHIPATTFPALDPIFVIILAPIMNLIWTKCHKGSAIQLTVTRVIVGLFFGAASFVLFAISVHWPTNQGENYRLLGIIIGNLLLATGEISLAPTLMAAVTTLAPKKIQGTFMGIWFLLIAFAGYLSSLVAKLSATTGAPSISGYQTAFIVTAVIAFVAFIVILCSRRIFN